MTKETRRRAALNALAASSLSDDSDSEIIFDRNALLNARKRRRRQRSSSRITNFLNNETLKWKLVCLSAVFLCMGLATTVIGLTKPDIMANVNEGDLMQYGKIFVYGGVGYFIGSIFVSLIFTRLNAYLCVLFLFGISIPFSTLIIYQNQLDNVKYFVLFQFCLFGAIERGGLLIIYGILKGDLRTLFMLFMAFSVGSALCAILTREEVFLRANLISQQAHLLSKREIANIEQVLNTTEDVQAVTRPHSAFGIDEDQNTKTRENTEKRKQAENLKDSGSTASECKGDGCSTEKPKTQASTIAGTTQKSTTLSTTTTTQKSTTLSTTTQKPTDPTTVITYNRARNRSPTMTTAQPNTKSWQKERKEHTASQFVYFLIMLFSLATVGLFILGFCACCIRCNLIADVRVAQIALDASEGSQIPGSTRLLLISCWFLQALPESILIALLPHYTLNLKYFSWSTQNNTALANFIFWLISLSFKELVFIYPYFTVIAKLIKISYFVGIPCCFLFHKLLAETEIVIYLGLLTLGLFVPTLPQLTLTYMQFQLDASPYLMTKYYCISLSLSKIFGPILAVWAIESSGSTHGMMTLLTVILCISSFVYCLLVRSVNPLARQRQLIELTGDINGRREGTSQPAPKQKTRKGQYEKLMEDDDADVEMDYVLAENALGSDSDTL